MKERNPTVPQQRDLSFPLSLPLSPFSYHNTILLSRDIWTGCGLEYEGTVKPLPPPHSHVLTLVLFFSPPTAGYGGKTETVAELLRAGARTDLTNSDGNTPLHLGDLSLFSLSTPDQPTRHHPPSLFSRSLFPSIPALSCLLDPPDHGGCPPGCGG